MGFAVCGNTIFCHSFGLLWENSSWCIRVGKKEADLLYPPFLFLCCRLQIFIYLFPFFGFFLFFGSSRSHSRLLRRFSSLVPILGLDGGNGNLLIPSVSFLVCLFASLFVDGITFEFLDE